MSEEETFEVQVAIYDLSNGMARSLSGQFLGPQYAIDAIPHTSIVVYGLEYFFGAGIQSEAPLEFRQSTGMFPIQTITLGRTRKNRRQFEQWCVHMMQSGQYSHEAYDLLSRNCNNFSHDAAILGLGLSQGVPEWILDVPRRFLSSPMGQIVRPMLEAMQLGNVAGAEHIGVSSTTTTATALPPVTTSRTLTANTVIPPTPVSNGATGAATTTEDYNPWANMAPPPPPPLPSPSSASSSANIGASLPPPPPRSQPASATAVSAANPPPPPPPLPQSKKSGASAAAEATKAASTTTTTTIRLSATPLLDSFNKPLLSTETNTMPLCVKKILSTVIPADPSVGATLEQEHQRATLIQAQEVLSTHSGSTSLTTLDKDLAEKVGRILLRCFHQGGGGCGEEEKNPNSTAVLPFALMMLRIVVLKMPTTTGNEESSLEACLQWVERALFRQDGITMSTVARAMAWLTVSNAYCGSSSSSSCCCGSVDDATLARRDALVEAALAELNSGNESRPEVRQAASAFLYNVALLLLSTKAIVADGDGDDALPDLHISILCATLEDVASEVDATTRLRRLMAAGRILQPILTSDTTTSTSQTSSNTKGSMMSNGNGPRANGTGHNCDELPTTALTNTVAKQLALDLGFADALQDIVNNDDGKSSNNNSPSNDDIYHTLAAELLLVLKQ